MEGWSQPWTEPSAWAETQLAPDKLGAPPQAEEAWLSLHLNPSRPAFLIHLVLGCLCLVLPPSPDALECTQRDLQRRFQGSSAPALHGEHTANPPHWLTQTCKRHAHAHAAVRSTSVISASPVSLVRLTTRHLSSSWTIEGKRHCAPWARAACLSVLEAKAHSLPGRQIHLL